MALLKKVKTIFTLYLIGSFVFITSCGYKPAEDSAKKETKTKSSAQPAVRHFQKKTDISETSPIIPHKTDAEKRITNLHRKAVQMARKGDYSSSLPLLKDALLESHNDPFILSDYIVVLSWADRHHEATTAYESLPPSFTPSAYVLLEAARSYRVLEKYPSAIRLYKKYLAENKDDQDAVKGLIQSYLTSDQIASARDFLRSLPKEPRVDSYRADILLHENKTNRAEKLYRSVLAKRPADINALTGLSSILIQKKSYGEAKLLIAAILKKDPNNFEALFLKGKILESEKNYIQAFKLYNRILNIYPKSAAARNLLYKALVNLRCSSLVDEKITQSNLPINPQIILMNNGNRAAAFIHWNEIDAALSLLETNEQNAALYKKQEIIDAEYYHSFIKQTSQDRITALKQKGAMTEVIGEYMKLKERETPLSYWAMNDTADAYLDMENPRQAQDLYRESMIQQGGSSPSSVRISLYRSLSEQGRYDESAAILDQLYKEMPDHVMDRGVPSDNWEKVDAAVNKGWSLLVKDQLEQAQAYFEEMHVNAPFNTNTRTGLAHTYLWRGWTKKALEEFEIIHSIDPKDLAGSVGYCYALHANDRWEEANDAAEELKKTAPNNKHVKKLDRYLTVDKLRTLSVDAGLIREYPGVIEKNISIKLAQPIQPWRTVYVGYTLKDTSHNELNDDTRRNTAGTDWRINRDIFVNGSISIDEDGNNYGYTAGTAYYPGDYFSFKFFYDSYSLSVPLRAKVTGIEAKEYTFNAGYRAHEGFSAEAEALLLQFSDDNKNKNYRVSADKSILNKPYWKFRISAEGTSATNSRTDVPYYSPQWIYTLFLIPMIEYIWFKRYEKYIKSRIFVQGGTKWQKSISGQDVWAVRYEQEHQLSDKLSFMIGASYAQKNYDKEDTDVWYYFTAAKVRF